MIQFITFDVFPLDAQYAMVKFFNKTFIDYIATSHNAEGYIQYHISYQMLTISQSSILLDYIVKNEFIENLQLVK
jgi:hypothetical protein